MTTTLDLPETDSRRRFSARVADYVRYRPHYPQALLRTFVDRAGLQPDWSIADIGSGTGFSSELFLQHGCRVTGIEPNSHMRTAGDEYLAAYANFRSVEGTAEATTLPDDSVNLVTAGQALHWFNLPLARVEFLRILKPGGKLAFFWNTRVEKGPPAMEEHVAIMAKYTLRENTQRHQDITLSERSTLFEPDDFHAHTIAWQEQLTLDEMIGRTISSSYMPKRATPEGDALIADLEALFERHAQDGKINFEYATELYFGSVARSES